MTPTESQREPECNMCKSGICSIHVPKGHTYKLGVHQDDCQLCLKALCKDPTCAAMRHDVSTCPKRHPESPPHTDENRELLKNWPEELNAIAFGRDNTGRGTSVGIEEIEMFFDKVLAAKDAECAEKIEAINKMAKLTKEDEELIENFEAEETKSGLKPWYFPVRMFKAMLKAKNLQIAAAVKEWKEKYENLRDEMAKKSL